MGRGTSKVGAGSGGKTAGARPKTLREIQIDLLEQKWNGHGKVTKPQDLKSGYIIDGVQYSFSDDKEAPSINNSAWSGTYDGIKMKVGANNSFKIISVKVGSKKTEITAEKLGGTPMTVKKSIDNNNYLRVYNKG